MAPTMHAEEGLEELQRDWKEMFQKTLPAAAASKSAAQVRPRLVENPEDMS
jgi:hypothetical protein